jgi:hypothetical protein
LDCEGFPAEDYGFYVLGLLDGPEKEQIQAHLASQCVTCTREIRAYAAVWHLVASSEAEESPASPPARLRRQILARTGGGGQRPAHWWSGVPVWSPAWAAGVALAAGITGTSLYFWRHMQVENRPVAELNAAAQQAVIAQAQSDARQWQDRAERAERALAAQSATAQRAPVAPAVTTQPQPDNSELQRALAAARSEATAAADALDRERARASRLETDLNAQRAALASAQRQRDDAEQRYQGASQEVARLAERDRQTSALAVRVQQLERENVSYRESIARLERQLNVNLRLAAFLTSPSLKLVKLRSTEAGGRAIGQAFVVEGERAVFYASNLPPLPAGRTYQLWLLRGRSPAIVSGGIFRPEAGRQLTVEVADPGRVSDIRGLAVTDEPEGGSPGPTGHKFLVGTARPS